VAEKPNGRDPKDGEAAREEVLGALHDVSNALTVMLGWIGEARGAEAETDVRATADGFISITPVHLDLTAYSLLPSLKEWGLS